MPRIPRNTPSHGLRVVSLFDGIGTGVLACQRAGISVSECISSEIDEDAITIHRLNYSMTIHVGSVESYDWKRIGKVDLLYGGPPCQSFSIAGDGKGFDDPRGLLLYEFLRVRDILQPRYFMMENVRMVKPIREKIDELLGVIGVDLDSARWSAQSRIRTYWTNIPQTSPLPISNAVIADVLYDSILFPIRRDERRYFRPVRTGTVNKGGQGDRIYSPWGKSITLNATSGGRAGPANLLVGTQEDYRRLTIKECERLQTLPSGYTRGVKESSRKRLIGNCWTVDVITYLLSSLSSSS